MIKNNYVQLKAMHTHCITHSSIEWHYRKHYILHMMLDALNPFYGVNVCGLHLLLVIHDSSIQFKWGEDEPQ